MDVYCSTIISGVSWFSEIAASVEGAGGLKAANKFTIRVPMDADFLVKHMRILSHMQEVIQTIYSPLKW